jgi:hypothetical protein
MVAIKPKQPNVDNRLIPAASFENDDTSDKNGPKRGLFFTKHNVGDDGKAIYIYLQDYTDTDVQHMLKTMPNGWNSRLILIHAPRSYDKHSVQVCIDGAELPPAFVVPRSLKVKGVDAYYLGYIPRDNGASRVIHQALRSGEISPVGVTIYLRRTDAIGRGQANLLQILVRIPYHKNKSTKHLVKRKESSTQPHDDVRFKNLIF